MLTDTTDGEEGNAGNKVHCQQLLQYQSKFGV